MVFENSKFRIADPKQSATTKKSILGELTKFAQSDGVTNGKLRSQFVLIS